MRKTILFLFFTLILISQVHAQEKDSLIQLYPGMGDTLDMIDREVFGLYKDVKGFQSARMFVREKKYFISDIKYLKDGLPGDTVLIEDISRFSEMRFQLNKFKLENDKKFESPLDASIFTTSGSRYNGRLDMFSKRYFFLSVDLNQAESSSSPYKYKTSVLLVDSLLIPEKQDVGKYILYGTAGGFVLGFFAGYATFDDDWALPKESKWLITGAIGAGVGFLLGWLIGESLPPNILTITFNSPNDILKLKEHSAYYYQKNPSFEEQYIGIE